MIQWTRERGARARPFCVIGGVEIGFRQNRLSSNRIECVYGEPLYSAIVGTIKSANVFGLINIIYLSENDH